MADFLMDVLSSMDVTVCPWEDTYVYQPSVYSCYRMFIFMKNIKGVLSSPCPYLLLLPIVFCLVLLQLLQNTTHNDKTEFIDAQSRPFNTALQTWNTGQSFCVRVNGKAVTARSFWSRLERVHPKPKNPENHSRFVAKCAHSKPSKYGGEWSNGIWHNVSVYYYTSFATANHSGTKCFQTSQYHHCPLFI